MTVISLARYREERAAQDIDNALTELLTRARAALERAPAESSARAKLVMIIRIAESIRAGRPRGMR